MTDTAEAFKQVRQGYLDAAANFGREAYEDGRPLTDCQMKHPQLVKAWEDGWRTAQLENHEQTED